MNKTKALIFALSMVLSNIVEGQLDDNTTNQLQIPEVPNAEPEVETFRVVFSPLHHATLSCEVSYSTVVKIARRMGESFKKDDLLVKLDDTVYRGLLEKAEGELEKAQVEAAAKQKLYEENIASYLELKAAQAAISTAEADVIASKKAIAACTINAPYDGKVVEVFVEEHEFIQQGKPIIEIVDDSSLIAKLLLPSNLLSKLFIEKEIEINVQETQATVKGKIIRINSVIDPASSLIKVDVIVDNKDGMLKSGMIGTIQGL